jgi:hypothetical protein
MPKLTKHLKKNRINRTMKRNLHDSRQKYNKVGGGLNDIRNAYKAANLGYNASRVGTKLSNINNVSNFSDLKNQITKSGIQNNVNNIGKQLGFDANKYYNDNLKGKVDEFKNSGIQDNINKFRSKATDYYNTNLKGKVDDLTNKLKNGERQGILDMVGNTISGATSFIADNGLSLVGLERIGNSEQEPSRVVSDAKNFANKASVAVVNNINKVLGSEAVSQTVEQAGRNTALITEKLAENFNRAMEDPVLKAKVKKAIENAGEIGGVVVKAAEEPLKKLARVSGKAATTAFGAASSGAIKVGTDMLGAIPGVGGIIEIGKMINDGSKAASAIVEAGSEAVEVASDTFIDTTENVKKELKDLEEQKKMSQEISNRTNESIKTFENPQQLQVQAGGFNKTKRKFSKHTSKSRKVRFAI